MKYPGERSYATSARVTATAALIGLLASGCTRVSGGEGSAASPSADTSVTAPFKVTRKWVLPSSKQLDPPFMAAEQCAQGFWLDETGKRRPPETIDPLVVRADSRCNTPLNSDVNGVYYEPWQQGRAPIRVQNGEPLGVECYKVGQGIQDIRGAATNSAIWLGVVTTHGAAGFIPEINVGYVDESSLPQC